jgi:hypothetical protein
MNYFFILVAIVFICYVFNIIKKGEFSVEESIFWVIGTIAVLVLSIWPKILDKVANRLNIDYPPSLLFLLTSMFLLFIIFRDTKKISKQNNKITDIAQRVSILEYENNKLKNKEK